MNKKYKRYLDEIERTEAKIAELQEYLKITKAALKQEEELEMIKAIRSMKLKGRDPVSYTHLDVYKRQFFSSAINILQTLVVAIGAGLGVWGVINLMEGYGNDNPGAKSQGIKQLMSGGGVILIGTQLIPLLGNLFG